ncbi:MAG: 16S rRNA (guanine(527)-N(7))-methyltransferase RsmG [Nitrospirota bacterium]
MRAVIPVKILREGARALGVNLAPEQEEKFALYLSELLKWNKKINLTSITDPRDVVIKHFLDSLAVERLLPRGRFKAADIGSGAGFPGLALGVIRADMELLLVEPAHKKAAFLRHAARLLAVGAAVVEERAEGLADLYRGRFDIILSRAFKASEDLLPLARPLLKEGGGVVLSLGPGMGKSYPGWRVLRQEEITLPFSDIKRALVLLEK